jgi:hypothetical protein
MKSSIIVQNIDPLDKTLLSSQTLVQQHQEVLMGALIFKSDKFDPYYKRLHPYRPYQPLSLRWAVEDGNELTPGLTPDLAVLDRIPEGLPDQVVRAIEGFVNDAKIHGYWFCVHDGDLDDDQDEDVLTAAAYRNDQGYPFIMEYKLHMAKGFYGPSIELLRTLCLQDYRNISNDPL